MKKFVQAAAIVLALGGVMATQGCAVARGQQTVSEAIDDTAITTAVKAKFVEDKVIDAVAISVETLNGTVQLSGFAKSANEKARAESDAKSVKGVQKVVNNIIVKP